jgi:hypothetical protein
MSDTTTLGDEFSSTQEAEVKSEVLCVQPDDIAIRVNKLEIIGDKGPIIIDGQEVRHVTGIKLEWSVDTRVWKAEITKLIQP